jgi:cytoskeleton protein RodZ
MFEIGSTLRQARDRRHLGLDQAEAETKVRARYLRALEDEDFDLLPGPTYVKGFLRTYAEYLGLDGQLFVDEYNSRHLDVYSHDETLFPRRRSLPARQRRSRREQNVVLVVLAAIVAVSVLVIVAATYRPPSEEPPPFVDEPPAISTEIIGNPAISAAQEQKDALTAGDTTTTGATGPSVRLQVVAVAPCWVTIRTGRGSGGDELLSAQLEPESASAGRTKVLRSPTGFTVELGAKGCADLIVNGKRSRPGSTQRIFASAKGKLVPLTAAAEETG